jgi:nicotinate-nucleotide pyrophosphorylase (carboxylating)
MDDRVLASLLEDMLCEDVGSGDVTSAFTPDKNVKAVIKSTKKGFISGIYEVKLLLRRHGVKARAHVKDGGAVRCGQTVLTLQGGARDILTLERTVLNVLSRMSGVTTLTRRYVDAVRKTRSKARVAATRKTTPGFRHFEKKAVVLGGGVPHRMGLYDMVLIKDNHLALFGKDVRAALTAAHKSGTKSKVEVEVSSVKDALTAAECTPDAIMLDNMRLGDIRTVVSVLQGMGCRRSILLEVSGGVTLKNISHYAKTGVDWISVGRLTHSAPTLDFSLEVCR